MNQRRYFCHACTNQGALRDGLCSRCSSSFVEELGEQTTGEDPRSFTLGTLGNPIQDFLASFIGTQEQEGQEQSQSSNFRPPSPPANTATHPGQRRGFVMLGNPANPIRFSFGDSREDREMPSLSDFLANSFQPPPIHRETHPNSTANQPDQQAGVGIGGYLQQLLSSLFNGPAGVPNVMFNNGQAQFGAYILSQAAFDRFIDDLMQNQQPQGPPPASKETIDSLPRGIVDKQWLDAQDILDCSVCKDDFQIGDKNITLPYLMILVFLLSTTKNVITRDDDGTDSSQGKGQLLSNIGACLAVVDCVASTLGPRGMDKLILLEIVHPAAKSLVDIARAQDAEVGDGTTSVTLLAGEMLRECKSFIEEGVNPYIVIKGYRKATQVALEEIKKLAIPIDKSNPEKFREHLLKCAATSMSSKLIQNDKPFFTNMAVDAVMCLNQDDLNEELIGVKRVPGGGMQDSLLINGVAFKKTFSYAGFEQQPKSFTNPSVLCLNVELELKAEKDNAEVRVEDVNEYQKIVDAEWDIIYQKLDAIVKTGAKVVLSKLPIGDLATQYFADRDIFCAGRVASDDMKRVVQALGGAIQSTVTDIDPSKHLGHCGKFEERQIGSERFNIFTECPASQTCTIILRGGAEQFIAEVERSLHDAIMIVRRTIKHSTIVGGGGAIEMELSKRLRDVSKSIQGKQQLIISAFAKSLEGIPRQLCDNAGFDATDLLNKLRMQHAKGDLWAGVDIENEGVGNSVELFIWEPALVKMNAIASASEAACLVLSVDETIRNPQSEAPNPSAPIDRQTAQSAMRGRGGMRGGRGRGRRM
ncbi:hypothetical protein E3Q13_00395 [Wallemia mellicola]|nr:hypothetical protein E3Q13_00395 [Wallemia mellicola]